MGQPLAIDPGRLDVREHEQLAVASSGAVVVAGTLQPTGAGGGGGGGRPQEVAVKMRPESPAPTLDELGGGPPCTSSLFLRW